MPVQLLHRSLALVGGWTLVGIAISFIIALQFGPAPYDVLNVGVGRRLDVAPGTAMWLTGTVLVVLAWLLGQRPGVGTPLGFLVIGQIINVTLGLIGDIDGMTIRILILVPALIGLYVGVCLIIVSGLGAGPTEVFMLALVGRSIPLRTARWLIEAGCAGVGVLLGGTVGVLTVLIVVLAAPIIGILLPMTTRLTGLHPPAR